MSREARKKYRPGQGRRGGGKENWNSAKQEDYNGGFVPYHNQTQRGEDERYRGYEVSRGNTRLGDAGDNVASGEVKFKGRGSMKYKEMKR